VTVGLALDVFGAAAPLPVQRAIGQVVVTEVASTQARAKTVREDIPLQRGWRVQEVQQQ
jgi:hypothetical protein